VCILNIFVFTRVFVCSPTTIITMHDSLFVNVSRMRARRRRPTAPVHSWIAPRLPPRPAAPPYVVPTTPTSAVCLSVPLRVQLSRQLVSPPLLPTPLPRPAVVQVANRVIPVSTAEAPRLSQRRARSGPAQAEAIRTCPRSTRRARWPCALRRRRQSLM
jgi:hypothetical protein